ncbi:pseudouridine-5'-phosphate glycosidase [Hoeflea sp. YIM 152468]|uniref:pseudouridine-5'-phosphate glycosidase n=1 Tax=Hoeflea sp. YIM 152468 TaxID=3031759 RepID=UPI0023DC3921|nr:pseudouridine-5'-phosphate glycosidase [Hoeflea sp. YIM 152468]MDF1607442.1 pseudouridine-5'-phosphate glycosidase [Hoeflea sp. YIM 152468]
MTGSIKIETTREVADALAAGRPVVALESTIITHGMPWPGNRDMALEVEATIRAEGAVPATIAVLEGQLHVGLDEAAITGLAQAKNVMKLSRADFAFALAEGRTGATTVAATMMAAKLAGISVFATGGIGGVHQGAELSFDISADLDELARTAVIVVSAGAKAILDIPKTLEALESRGVPVVAYGQDQMPAFWSRDSGLPAPLRLDDAAAIARFEIARRACGGHGGMLIANPVPARDEIPADQMRKHIATALDSAKARGIEGKQVTPFLLGEILTLTNGASLKTNIALVLNNARLAARIATALASAAK